MRIISLLVAFSGITTNALAFSRSKVQRKYQSGPRCPHSAVPVAASGSTTLCGLKMTLAYSKALQEEYARKTHADRFSIVNYRSILTTIALVVAMSGPAFADEYGVEKEAPTLFTGETVEICTKRGPLGACLKTEMRTSENDNDVAKKYFRDPAVIVQQQKVAVLQKSDQDSDDGNALIQKLRQQSVDNREKNDLYVARKTFEADQSATFGPFDRQVLIMNTDGKTYTLLENPVAMRLKKAGFIDDRRSFITQPTPEDLDAASEKEPGFFGSFLGGGNN